MADKRDQRFEISDKFRAETLKNHLDEHGYIKVFPSKEKKKIVLLQELMSLFKKNQHYTEKQVNDLIVKRHADYAAVRRYLIDYGFLERQKDGRAYWVL